MTNLKPIEEIVYDGVHRYEQEMKLKRVPADVTGFKNWLRTTLTTRDAEWEGKVRDIIDLSDKIEREWDTSLEEWKAFKQFRNTLRDRYLPPNTPTT